MTEVDRRPLCPVCNKWRLTQLGPLYVCAGCERAWNHYEIIAAAQAAQEDRNNLAALRAIGKGGEE